MRILGFSNGFVILEKIYRTADCDADDVITSQKFTLETEPKDWEYETSEIIEQSET